MDTKQFLTASPDEQSNIMERMGVKIMVEHNSADQSLRIDVGYPEGLDASLKQAFQMLIESTISAQIAGTAIQFINNDQILNRRTAH